MISGGFPIRMPKRSPAVRMADPEQRNISPQMPTLPPELEARIEAFEIATPTSSFDIASWFWMILLGVALPLALLAIGWWV
jgi:hypothetical protein